MLCPNSCAKMCGFIENWLLSTPVQLLINANIYRQPHGCSSVHLGILTTMFKTSNRMEEKVILGDPDQPVLGFSIQPSLGFTENGLKKGKLSSELQFLGVKMSCWSQVEVEWSDPFELIGRHPVKCV